MAPKEKRFLRHPSFQFDSRHGEIHAVLQIEEHRFALSCERARGKWLVYWDAPLELCQDDIYTIEDRSK